MKLLVTGGAGFIGSNFIRYWLDSNPNDSIINLDALTYAGHRESLSDLENDDRYRFVEGDIRDAALVDGLVGDCDIIVHFAAESHVDRSISDSSEFLSTNVIGTGVLLEAARKYGRRFHHVSTDEVFGALAKDDSPFSENTPYSPRSPYSASKASSDHLVRAYYHTYGLPITISNCSNNYGPYQFPEKLIPLFITNLMAGKPVTVYGDGSNIRDWIHVQDHNRGVEAIIKQGKIGETYCLGGGNELSNLEITKEILSLMGYGEEMIQYVPDRLGHDWRYAIDYSKAERELGWKPEKEFAQGIRETVKWYQDNQAWWEEIKNKNN